MLPRSLLVFSLSISTLALACRAETPGDAEQSEAAISNSCESESGCSEPEPVPDCAMEIGIVCPRGKVDECTLDPGGSHRCVPEPVSDCAMEIGIVCASGEVDECTLNPRGTHRCVPEPVSDCAMEIGILCPPGEVDECTLDPNSSHRCVRP